MRIHTILPTLGLAALFAAGTCLTGCDSDAENAAEDTGEAIEDAAENTGEAIEDGAENVKDAVE